MRTRTLLSVTAALAVGAVTAQAQVYSVNVVGYVNQANAGGALALVQNPLDDGTNTLTSVLPTAPPNSVAYVWNGSAYDQSVIGGKAAPGAWSLDLAIPTGLGFFFNPGSDHTNTYVGEVLAGPGESVTNVLAAGVLDLTGSLLPLGTTNHATDTVFGLTTPGPSSVLYKYNGTSYDQSVIGGKASTWDVGRPFAVGEAFFINVAGGHDWVQTLP